MKRRMKKMIVALLVFIILCSCMIQTAYAYVACGYKLIGGPTNRQYCISGASVTQDGVTINYGSNVQNAVTSWNGINATSASTVDVSFSKQSGVSGAEIIFLTTNRGANGWYGFTYYYDGNGNYINKGGYPNKNYVHTSAYLNTHYLHSVSSQKRTNVAAHEMGHALGLKHNTQNASVLMWDEIATVTSVRPPQADDIYGIRSIYA